MSVAVAEARARRLVSAVEPATLLLGVLTAGVFALRLSQLHQSMYGDELFTYHEVVGHSLASVVRTIHTGPDNSPPLFFVLAWASAKLGDPTVWIRLPSLLLGVATIPLIFGLGRETVGRVPGLIAAAVVAASPFSTYYGIEARPYATMAFFVALSTLALIKAIRTSSRGWWLVYALAAAGAAYTHYTSIFVLAVQAAWSLWLCRGRLREPLLANLLVVLLYIPWLPQVRGSELQVIGVLEPLTAHNVLTDLLRPIPGYPWGSLRGIPTITGLAIIGACAALGLAALVLRWRVEPPEQERRPLLLLLPLLAIVTPIGLLVYSILGPDVWSARGLYASVPAAALVLGALLWALRGVARALGVAAVLVTLLAGTIRAISPSYARPPFRAAAAYIDRLAGPRDPVIFYPTFETLDIAAQFKHRHRTMGSSPAQWRAVAPGDTAILVIDDRIAQRLNIGTPHAPPGFVLTGDRMYPSQVWSFTLLSYRRLPAS